MSELNELPEGIYINKEPSEFYYEIEFEFINENKCNKCNIVYESFLMSNASRHEGNIVIRPSNKSVWRNTLSKTVIRH